MRRKCNEEHIGHDYRGADYDVLDEIAIVVKLVSLSGLIQAEMRFNASWACRCDERNTRKKA